jgi:protein-S-isoprenylcysteine O-methyltransferase Ste14
MGRLTAVLYGVVAYAVGMFSFLCLAGFLVNTGFPNTIDGEPVSSFGVALAVNLGLIAVFGVQHSVMARPTFKSWWTKFVPASVERSTYVLLSAVAMFLLLWFWQPMGGVIWDVQSSAGRAVLYGGYAAGWVLVLVTTFLINHFDLFGLRQVWLRFTGGECTHLRFTTPGPYRLVRHPLYVGWLVVFWATPTMTVAHLVLALGIAAYILIAIQLEERNLVAYHEEYETYRQRVPMLIPVPKKRPADLSQPSGASAA